MSVVILGVLAVVLMGLLLFFLLKYCIGKLYKFQVVKNLVGDSKKKRCPLQ